MSQPFHMQEHVRWSDVDASGLIRWSAYTRLLELAETELFRAAGFPYASLWEQLDVWLPRVQCHFDYRSPVRLDELLDLEIWVGHIGHSSIRLEFAVRRPDAQTAAEGHLVMVAIARSNGEVVAVPQALVDALARFRVDAGA